MGILSEKSLHFAARIIKLHRYLIVEKKEYVISKQIVRSGTSIGANINEANYGSSRADFINKMQIALKEAAETEYWLNLLILSDYLPKQPGNDLLNGCLEIKRLLISTVNTAKAKGQDSSTEIPPLE
ncbi:MAG: four helix bundle protein [Clostridia bacterium]|nr:four helix bundle protein [Clostridia bacterium]